MKKVNSPDIEFIRPPLDDFLVKYNNLFGKIIRDNYSLKYLSSATLNRMEGQTHFYEYLEKYIQIKEKLTSNSIEAIHLEEADLILFKPLNYIFPGRVFSSKRKIKNVYKFFPRLLRSFFLTQMKTLISICFKKKKHYDFIIRTWFDFRNTGSRLREEYFGDIVDEIAKDYKILCVFDILSSKLKDHIDFIKIRNSSYFDTSLLESFLTPLTVTRAFWRYINSRIIISKRIIYKNHDITELINIFLKNDYYCLRGLIVFLEYEVALKMLYRKPKRILFPYENQTWEKTYGLAKSIINSNTYLLGFQHSGFSYKLLQFFPSKPERELPIYPDKIVTMGEITKRVMIEKGNYPCKIVEGAAMRQAKHLINGKFEIKSKPIIKHNALAYAFSYEISNYKAIVDTLINVFRESGITIYLKFHPDFSEKTVQKILSRKLPEKFLPSTTMDWNLIYNSVDLILYNDNSLGIEGMINGVKTIKLDIAEPIYNTDRFFYSSLDKNIVDETGLIKIKNELQNGTYDNQFHKDRISKYVNKYYNAYNKNEYLKVFTD